MVNELCRHSSSGKDCEFFVAHTIEEKIQRVSSVNKPPAKPGCCNAATKRLSNTLFSVVISNRQRKEVSHGTHTFLECSDDQCSVPLRRHDDFYLRRPKRSQRGQGQKQQTLPNLSKKCMAPETAPCIFIFSLDKAQAAAPVTGCWSLRAKPTPSQTAETMAARFIV